MEPSHNLSSNDRFDICRPHLIIWFIPSLPRLLPPSTSLRLTRRVASRKSADCGKNGGTGQAGYVSLTAQPYCIDGIHHIRVNYKHHSCLIHPTCNCLICPTCNFLFPEKNHHVFCCCHRCWHRRTSFPGPKNSCPSTSTKLWGLMISESRWTPASNTSFHLYFAYRTRFLDFLPFLISFLFLFPTKSSQSSELLSLIALTILLVQYEM